MLIKKLSVFICSSLLSCMVIAQNAAKENNTDEIIDSFLQCDSQFFEQLAKNKKYFSQYADLDSFENIAYIPVQSMEYDNSNTTMLKKPIKYKGLTIVGYQNIYIPTTLSGKFYYWGFIFNNNLDEVKNNLKNLNWLPYNNQVYIANPKIYDQKNKALLWQDNPYSIDMVIPRLWTVEKSLYLENIADNQSRIACSIQGDIEKDILYLTRPDMKPLDAKIEAKRQEKIKAYKLKKQKENEENLKSQQKKDMSKTSTENKSKDGDKI